MTRIDGSVAPGFEKVRDAFAANFTQHGDVGAACCVYRGDQPVVDIWGGYADREQDCLWNRDTLEVVFSATKGMTTICLLQLVERGMLDLDTPVARYWPAFAANGKEHIPLRWILSHRAGLALIEGKFSLPEALSWTPVVDAIAAQPPNWPPGAEHGYHMRSFGWILGEIVRRVTGKTLGRFFADEIATPLGLELWIGLPERAEQRVAKLYPPAMPTDPAVTGLLAKLMGPDTFTGQVMTGPSGLFHYDDMWNQRALHAAELPSSNGIGTARALARAYAATIGAVGGVRLLNRATITDACAVQSEGKDKVLHLPTRFGTGFMLPPSLSLAAAPSAFGHPGAGGSLGLADPEANIGFGYVMNQMRFGVTGDPRAEGILGAVYDCL